MFIPYQNTHNAANLLYMFIRPSNMPRNTANFFFVDIFLFHSGFELIFFPTMFYETALKSAWP